MSNAEKLHAIKHRLVWTEDDEIDTYPLVRRIVPAGQWGIKAAGLRRAQPFDGLMA